MAAASLCASNPSGCFDSFLGARRSHVRAKGLTLTSQLQERCQEDAISTLVQNLLNDRVRPVVEAVYALIPAQSYLLSRLPLRLAAARRAA
jgi:hypothetical protein